MTSPEVQPSGFETPSPLDGEGMGVGRLIEFAKGHRQRATPGVEVVVTPRYQLALVPDFPIPGPNSASWIRCEPDEVDDVISEARATFTARNLPLMWVLDPDTQPSDFATRLAAHGFHPDPRGEEVSVMVLPAGATLEAPVVPGLELHDGLADLAAFRAADAVAAEAFMSAQMGDDPDLVATQERRRVNGVASGNLRLLLATVHGEPAGAGSVSLFPPRGATINGGSVRPAFRGQGVYRALVAARLEVARREGAAGLVVWAGSMSKPILSRLGFQSVSWRRFYR
jgi:GNAT superfamily N-acetyltransferase